MLIVAREALSTPMDRLWHNRIMGTKTVELMLPAELAETAKLEPGSLPQETSRLLVRLLALELFREEKVSLGKAAELSCTPLAEFMDFAADHGVPPLNYTNEDLEQDRRTFERLRV